MTSLTLLLWIATGIVVQLSIYLGIQFWRHWLDYQALRSRASDLTEVPRIAEGTAIVAWSGFRTFQVTRKVFEDVAQTVCSFYLIPEDGQTLPAFLPGQFLTFRLEVPTVEGSIQPIIRCYSLSEAPGPDEYRVTIKRLNPPGRSSSYFHDHVTTGSLLQARAPCGHFYIDNSDAPVVLIGGGIGMTPLLSMLNWSLNQQPGREIWLFYGIRNSTDMVMKSHLESLVAAHPNFQLRVCFSDPLPDDVVGRCDQHRTRVDVNVLRMQLPIKPYHFYICGPTRMMEDLIAALDVWGVPNARIHFEAFGPASINSKPVVGLENETKDTGIIVNFAKSGRQLPWQHGVGTLLEFAEANGIAVDSGCRAGGCGSCQTTIQSGEVSYRQSPDYDPEPGTCLLCLCTPKTSITLEV